ncbi:MAG: type II toxin-antitoxin system RelE/ParE family toxin [Verrucomicrobia bacterium]|nr:type II toxin-antitoxin system RelE/ParE family toxin [Verrucomicrobiota bacterium]
MPAKIHAAAESRLIEIWNYTLEKWGEKKADAYVRRLVAAIHSLGDTRHLWRRVPDKTLAGIWFARHEHHYIFFRELSRGTVGIITVLHESMDLPARIKDDENTD